EAERFLLEGLAVRTRLEAGGGGLWVDSVPTAGTPDLGLGGFYQETGRPQGAGGGYPRAGGAAPKKVTRFSGLPSKRSPGARAFCALGNFLSGERRPKEAAHAFRRGGQFCEGLILETSSDPFRGSWNLYLQNLNGLRIALNAQGQATEAADVERQAQDFCANLAQQHPAAMPNDMRFHHLLVSHYAAKRQTDKAFALYARAIELNESRSASWSNRGDAYASLSQWDRAA